MMDGLQNVPVDRLLMRIKDIVGICASLLQIVISLGTIIFIIYSFFTKIDALTKQLSILQQQQSATQQMVVHSPFHHKHVNDDEE